MILKHLVCTSCGGSADPGLLFDALYMFATKGVGPCFTCGGIRQLHLRLDFGRATAGKDSVVLAAFLPRTLESWIDAAYQHAPPIRNLNPNSICIINRISRPEVNDQ